MSHLHFKRCSGCPIADSPCIAQLKGSSRHYCDRIKAGDAFARELAIDHSTPRLPPPAEAPAESPAPQPPKRG